MKVQIVQLGILLNYLVLASLKRIFLMDRWIGNKDKAIAKVLLPIIEDLLCWDMVALLRAYLDIIQLAYYTQ